MHKKKAQDSLGGTSDGGGKLESNVLKSRGSAYTRVHSITKGGGAQGGVVRSQILGLIVIWSKLQKEIHIEHP